MKATFNQVGFHQAAEVPRREHGICFAQTARHHFPVRRRSEPAPSRLDEMFQGLKHQGAGLGLQLLKALIELQGVALEITSKPGIGTAVCIYFPGRRAMAVGALATPTTTEAA